MGKQKKRLKVNPEDLRFALIILISVLMLIMILLIIVNLVSPIIALTIVGVISFIYTMLENEVKKK